MLGIAAGFVLWVGVNRLLVCRNVGRGLPGTGARVLGWRNVGLGTCVVGTLRNVGLGTCVVGTLRNVGLGTRVVGTLRKCGVGRLLGGAVENERK